MLKEDIYIIGAGTYGETMHELANILGYNVKGFYDEDKSKIDTFIMDTKVLGKFSELPTNKIKNKNFIVAIGNNEIRFEIMRKINKLEGETPTLIHPTAIISPSVKIGIGVYVQANAYLWTKVSIGNFCIISPGVVIAHHSKIGEACLISSNSTIGASININEKVFVGMGSTVVTGLSNIGGNSIIGAGAVVLKNTDENSVYAGIPAKKIRSI
ncbi:acetyltransferase [Fictibacillus sp. NRS-1165]|uniref:acetyltransferase n=1 Tax=Fictibacillus sp. NRS-1165 TaxID=3144463 RepID=UPI003D1A5879